jgi:acyl carrier protein
MYVRLVVLLVCSMAVVTACIQRPTATNEDATTRAQPPPAAQAKQTEEELAGRVKGVVGKQLSRDPGSIDVKVPLARLGADELDVVEIILELEVQLNISIKDEELGDPDSYKTLSTENLIDIVKKKKLVASSRQ